MIFKTLNGDLTVFNKTLISTKDNLKALETVNATVYNKNGAFNLQGLLVNSSQSVSTFTKLNNAFKAYNGNLSKSTQLQNAYIQAVGKQNTSLGNYLAGLNGAKASIGGYVKSLIGAKAATIGLQVASVALNTAISMGLSLAISALISAITKWVNKEKEAREEAIENAKAAKEESNNLSKLLNKYNQLSKEVHSNQGVKEDLLSVQSDLLEALGIEASQIDTLIEKYGDLSTAINQVTLDSLRDAQGDLMVAIDAYEKDLIKIGKGYAHWYSSTNRNLLSAGHSSTDALDILEKAGIIGSGSHGKGGGALILTGDDKTIDGILENYQKLKDAQEALNVAIDNGEITMEEMIKIPLYNDINSRLDELDESIENYNTAIADLNKNIAQQQILKSLAEPSSIPETKEEFESFQQSMIDAAVASTKFKGSQDDIRDSIINVLSTMPEFEKYFEELSNVQSPTSDNKMEVSTLSISETIGQLNTQIKPAFNSLKSAWNDIFTDDGFALNSIDILSACDSIKSKLDELNKLEGIIVDYSSFEDFVRVLSDTGATEQDVKDAFDSLADSIARVGVSGKEDFSTLKAALEDLGVINNEIIAFRELTENTDMLKAAGIDLATATYEQISAFASEYVSVENLAQAIHMLTQQKMLSALEGMDTSTEVSNMISLAKQAGMTSEIIANLTELEKIYQEVARGTLSEHMLSRYIARADELKQLITAEVTKVDYTPKVDFSGVAESAKKSASSAAQSFTDLLDKELAVLDKKMEAGYIDFNDYIQARLALIENYYKQGKIKADEYYSYLEKHYKQELSYRDKVIKAVTRRIDKEIDSLKKQKDTIEDSYQLQIDALEKEKTLLQDANKERQRQLDLQKAMYELERARNQRTKLVKYMPDTIVI